MGSLVRVTLFTTHERAIDALLGGGGESARTVCGERWFRGDNFDFCASRPSDDQLLQFGQESLPAAAELNPVEIADSVENAVSERLLVRERFEHALFDGIFGDQIDHRDRAGLVLALGAGDALFEF